MTRRDSSRKDRTFGLGSIDGDSDVLVLTAGILMRALIDEEAVAKFDPEHGRANLIKSTMTQSILYGSNPEVGVHCALLGPFLLTLRCCFVEPSVLQFPS